MAKQRKAWSDSEVTQLRELLQKKWTYEQIAKKLNRGVSSVASKVHKTCESREYLTGGDHKYFTHEEIKVLHERNVNGETLKSISKDVGICTVTLLNRFSRFGYKPVNVNKKIDIQLVIAARANNVPWKEVPAYIGVSSSWKTVEVALSKYKKKSGS